MRDFVLDIAGSVDKVQKDQDGLGCGDCAGGDATNMKQAGLGRVFGSSAGEDFRKAKRVLNCGNTKRPSEDAV